MVSFEAVSLAMPYEAATASMFARPPVVRLAPQPYILARLVKLI